MACAAVAKGIVKRKGKPSIEWYKDGKPQYYCYGYMDMMTECPIKECIECNKYWAQSQKDIEKYLFEHKNVTLNVEQRGTEGSKDESGEKICDRFQ